MSDFEQRVGDALAAGATAAPSAVGLADAARQRARSRRRTRLGVAAVVAVLGVGIPTGVVALDDSEGSLPSPAGPSGRSGGTDATEGVPSPASGYRFETWHGVQLQAPDYWEYGALSTWCIQGDDFPDSNDTAADVERPGVVEDIACTPTYGYGVSFAESSGSSGGRVIEQLKSGTEYPRGAWVGSRVIGEVLLTVAAYSEVEAQFILDSAEIVEGVDGNGCAPADSESAPAPEPGTMAVCRYDEDGLLEQSELLSEDEVAAAVEALAASPSGELLPACEQPEPWRVVMTTRDLSAVVEFGGGCPRVTIDEEQFELTEDVLYWALSPGWSGGVPGGTPLPAELRQR